MIMRAHRFELRQPIRIFSLVELLSVEDEQKQFVSCHLSLLIFLCFGLLYLDFSVDFRKINEIFLKFLHLISEPSCSNNVASGFDCFRFNF